MSKSQSLLREALQVLKSERKSIDKQIGNLAKILGAGQGKITAKAAKKTSKKKTDKKRKPMSAAGRKAISIAMKKRWAKKKKSEKKR